MKITKDELQLIWNTNSCHAFNKLNFDNRIDYTDIDGTEMYLVVGEKKHLEGYIAKKLHVGKKVQTVYFIPTKYMEDLPLLIGKTTKIHSSGRVFHVIDSDYSKLRIVPEHVFSWRQLVQYTGIPTHTNKMHWLIYKLKRLYGRTKGKFYGRIVTESGFGKDKLVEAYRHLLGASMVVSDPTVPKVTYAVCHSRDLTINELPQTKDSVLDNMLMRIGDGSNILDNRARATTGTHDVIDISNLSVFFLHNIAEYYHSKNKDCFEQVFTYNVINRYYYNRLDGALRASFPTNIDFNAIAEKYAPFYKAWIKSVYWYMENWQKLSNQYSDVSLDEFEFSEREERFRDHFLDFAKCVSHYAKDKEQYLRILRSDYLNHQAYKKDIATYESVRQSDTQTQKSRVTEEVL